MGIMQKIRTAVHRVEWRFRQWVAIILGAGTIGFGISIMFWPASLRDLYPFRVTLEWAAPELWGGIGAIAGLLLVITAFVSVRQMVWPASSLSLWYTLLSVSILAGASLELPIPLVIWVYLTMGAISGIVAYASAIPKVKKG